MRGRIGHGRYSRKVDGGSTAPTRPRCPARATDPLIAWLSHGHRRPRIVLISWLNRRYAAPCSRCAASPSTVRASPNWWTPSAKLRGEREGVEWARNGVILRMSSRWRRSPCWRKSSGRPLIQIASELGISPSTLRNWRHRSTGGHTGSAPHPIAAPPRAVSPRTSARQSKDRAVSFDYLVGAGEQRLRHGETERLRGFQVDHQLEAREDCTPPDPGPAAPFRMRPA